MRYVAPTELDEALCLLAEGAGTILAGGTDFYPARVGAPLTEPVLDISSLTELDGIERTPEGGYRIGALTRWADIVKADLPSRFDGLRRAAACVGGIQVQNAGTIAGNLCNASPAADGVPPLLTLDASVELVSMSGARVLSVGEFITGYRATALQPGELVTAILVPSGPDHAASTFLKLGSRSYLVISIAMVAALVAAGDDGTVRYARVAVGACSPVAQRALTLESDLLGRPMDADLALVPVAEHLSMLDPIDDIRASATYRRGAALTLVRRALREIGDRL